MLIELYYLFGFTKPARKYLIHEKRIISIIL